MSSARVIGLEDTLGSLDAGADERGPLTVELDTPALSPQTLRDDNRRAEPDERVKDDVGGHRKVAR